MTMKGGRNELAKYLRQAKKDKIYKLRILYGLKDELLNLTADDLRCSALLYDIYCSNKGLNGNVMSMVFLYNPNLKHTSNLEMIEAACAYGCDAPGIRVLHHLDVKGSNVNRIGYEEFTEDYVCTDKDCMCDDNKPLSWIFVE
eukprot:273564_1